MLDNLEVEVKNWNNAYSFSSEENGKKRIYTIFSPKLKQKLREIIFPCEVPSRVSAQYEGKNSSGDCILYQPGKDDLPDQLTLISRELAEQLKITDGTNEKDPWEKWDEEWKEVKEKWQKAETELGIPSGSIRHYWCGKDKDSSITNEGMYFKSETQQHLITLENKKDTVSIVAPQIQEITDKKESKDKKQVSERKEKEVKPDNKENFNLAPTSTGKAMTGMVGIVGALSVMIYLATK